MGHPDHMATITSDHMTALRAVLTGETYDWDRLGDDSMQHFGTFMAVAFKLALVRRFPEKGERPAEVARFVAALRTRPGGPADELDRDAAERLIRAVLGDQAAAEGLDLAARSMQIPLLRQLVADEQLDDEGLEHFLELARELTERQLQKE